MIQWVDRDRLLKRSIITCTIQTFNKNIKRFAIFNIKRLVILYCTYDLIISMPDM